MYTNKRGIEKGILTSLVLVSLDWHLNEYLAIYITKEKKSSSEGI